jgi:preprotein translocase subunit YajC
MHPETLPLLASTLVAYVALGAGMLFRVRRRRRSQLAARSHALEALRAG